MVFSSVRLSLRRCLVHVPSRARRCFLVILVVCLTSFLLLAMQAGPPKSGMERDARQKEDAGSSVARTKSPLQAPRSPEKGDERSHAAPPRKEEEEVHDEMVLRPQRHPLEEEPVYRTAPRRVKEPLEAALVFLEHSDSGRSLLNVLLLHRFQVKAALVHDIKWPEFTLGEDGRFSVFIFESLRSYAHLSSVKNKVLENYCLTYGAGIIILTQPETGVSLDFVQVRNFPLYINQHVKLKDPIVNQSSGVPRITRADQRFHGNLPGDQWITFRMNHSAYVPVMEGILANQAQVVERFNASRPQESRTCVVYDRGSLDGIRRVFFGYSVDHFLHATLLLDSVALLTNGRMQTDLDRYILIDIDDIFVGRTGIRLKESDVENLISVQETIRRDLVPGFRFNLGFSGKYYQHGGEAENAGDRRVLEEAPNFWWFPHMWDHGQPHAVRDGGKLRELMEKNKQFAVDHKIPITEGYSVAPHHSGVYPVHEELYEVWREVWKVQATSTEEYPHLRPAHKRRGFVHKGIMVLPRQTCSLYTKTNFFSDYRGGRQALDALIQGGELFLSLVSNPVNIFMTHMSNYGNDRLALYTFQRAFQFLRTYTNLRPQTLPPLQTARKYFELYPDEREPLWGNPCEDHRLMEIWAAGKDCTRLPNTLILGPQKTGTTALYTFLQMHKRIRSNRPSKETYEEVQFFNGPNYFKGLDWYLDFFPSNPNRTLHVFEKSANYFDSPDAPRRVKALLPRAKLIILLLDPAKRAYSWYHHMRSHNDETSLRYSFHEVISAPADAPRPLRSLQKRCLEPGRYYTHLNRWLQYFSSRQILLLDGELLRNSPPAAMQRVQKFLRLKPTVDYSRLLKYDSRKGFFCPVGHKNRTHCLGPSKGRAYPDMAHESAQYLKAYYRPENLVLSTMLDRMSIEHPRWLEDQLTEF